RFPGGASLSQWWEGLKRGESFITEVPPERWPLTGFYFEDTNQAIEQHGSYSKWGGFLDGVADFDPLFFNMTPNEAATTDPQERLFLEECWKALEDAGYAPTMLSDRVRHGTGVFGGITKQGFSLNSSATGQVCTTSFSSCVNRVSHMLNLRGPCLPVDTMCSSALVAIHEACEYLRSGQGEMALAGAVNLYLHPSTYKVLSSNRLMSTSADAQVFGANGDGFVPGEGVGVIVLKSLAQAEADGDHIHGVICGSAFNHSGRTNGYMTPSAGPQQEAISAALASNQIDPRSISYIESAANGSLVSDAVEMSALTRAFAGRTGTSGRYSLGTLKGQVGHGEAVSGMAQLFKVLFSLRDA
uniref:beta-ketoacyl [acyl carrier protein] synthase domain-containing protein n=1 Tax=Photorhabdus sp. RM71S TaxID=3342824 RepID=UPI0036DB47F6